MITFMRCYDVHSKELAIIVNNVISEITWHKNAMYIYWRAYDEGLKEYLRAGMIACDWTKCETVTNEVWNYIKSHSLVPVITIDTLEKHTREGYVKFITIR